MPLHGIPQDEFASALQQQQFRLFSNANNRLRSYVVNNLCHERCVGLTPRGTHEDLIARPHTVCRPFIVGR